MVIADPKHGGQEVLLKRLYEIYADYALKNPFYSIDMPIRWVSDSLKYVQIYKFPAKNTVDRPQQLLGLVNPGDLALDLEFREMTWEFTWTWRSLTWGFTWLASLWLSNKSGM